jgi:hypothetical protein
MDLIEALSCVGHLASEHCLLIARGCGAAGDGGEADDVYEPQGIEWAAGDIRDIGKLRGIEFVSEIGRELMHVYDEFAADSPCIMACAPMPDGTVTLIFLGVRSLQELAETLCTSAEVLVSRNVKDYLAQRLEYWKRLPGQAPLFPGPSGG